MTYRSDDPPLLLPRRGEEFDPETHTYTIDELVVPSVTQVLGATGFGPDYSMVPPETLEAARDRGTRTHAAIVTASIEGLSLDRVDEDIRAGVAAGWSALIEAEFEPWLIEQELVSPSLWLAGTLDHWCRLYGEATVLDVKTGELDRDYVGAQTAAYKWLLTDRLTSKMNGRWASDYRRYWQLRARQSRRYALSIDLAAGRAKLVELDDARDLARFSEAFARYKSAHGEKR